MKKALLRLAAFCIGIALAAFFATSTPCLAGETHIITDTMGRKVELKKDIRKLIAIPWPWASFIFAVDGSADRIASMSATSLASYKNCMFEVLAPGLDKVNTGYIDDKDRTGGSFGTLNIEEMARLAPDAVIIYKRDARIMLPILEAAGVPTVVFDFGGLKEVQDGLVLLGQMLGEKQAKTAATIIGWHHEADKLLRERLAGLDDSQKPSVLMLRDGKLRLYLSGFSDNMMKQAGARLATLSPDGKAITEANINFEQMLRWDPDYILLGNFANHTPDQIYDNIMASHDWSSLKAVKNKHVYKIPMGLYRWDPPSTEAHLLLLWEAKLFHPDLFRDIDLEQKTREFYKTIFGHDLTREELDMIYHAGLNAHSEPVK